MFGIRLCFSAGRSSVWGGARGMVDSYLDTQRGLRYLQLVLSLFDENICIISGKVIIIIDTDKTFSEIL